MRIILFITGFLLNSSAQLRVMRQAVAYQRLAPVERAFYHVPSRIYRRWPQLLALSICMLMTDTPLLFVWFGVSSTLFLGLVAARLFVEFT